MTDHSLKLAVENEINNARAARTNGNEGRARVCARRAAGIALREYFVKHSLPVDGLSGYQLLQTFINLPDIPTSVRQNAINLTSRCHRIISTAGQHRPDLGCPFVMQLSGKNVIFFVS